MAFRPPNLPTEAGINAVVQPNQPLSPTLSLSQQTTPNQSSATPFQVHYLQQTTTSLLWSSLVFMSLVSFACLFLFSWVRTRRGSIYGSRQFFVREEHRAEALPESFLGWIGGLLFLERKQEQEYDQGRLTKETVVLAESVDQVNSDLVEVKVELPAKAKTSLSDRSWRCAHHCRVEPVALLEGYSVDVGVTEEESKGRNASTKVAPLSDNRSTNTHRQQALPRKEISIGELARQAIITKIGLDHYLLIRFLKMLLSLSAIAAIFATAILIPLYAIAQSGEGLERASEGSRVSSGATIVRRVEMLQISNVTDSERLWATVVVTVIFSVLVVFWIWHELMMFLKLREKFLLRSASRYSSRVVLLQHIPPELRSVIALQQLFSTAASGGVDHVYLVRDTTALEQAVKQRQVILDKLEEAQSRYMDAIARTSALVATASLSLRSRSWLGQCIDHAKVCFRQEVAGPDTVESPGDEDYVGPLKLYQLDDLPKLPFANLSNSSAALSDQGTTPPQRPSNVSNSTSGGVMSPLKWYRKPRRPRHYVGVPLLTKRQDSIRYYRGELCRLNKVISQAYDAHAAVIAAGQQEYRRSGQQHHSAAAECEKLKSMAPIPESPHLVTSTSTASSLDQVNVLSSAFLLMRTRAGAKWAASDSIAPDKIPLGSRTLGIPPRDIEWRALGQVGSRTSHVIGRVLSIALGILFLVGSGMVVAAIASMAVFHGWTRVTEAEADTPAIAAVYMKQGILAPLLLAALMFASPWILNELCLYWGRVSKTETELLIQRYYSIFLMLNIAVLHPTLSLYFSWQKYVASEIDSTASFLTHAIPSYCSFATAYILTSGLGMPLYQLLQLPRLWATLPTVTIWSVLGPLSWQKLQTLKQGQEHSSGPSSSSSDPCFKANFSPIPSLTPRQAFQLRQPPVLCLQNLYPHLITLFSLSLALLPLAPILFLIWTVVLLALNLCYRYLVLQVVTTKSQSGGLHFRQALQFILFSTLICPPLLLAVYFGARQAWTHFSYMAVFIMPLMHVRVMVVKQFRRREEMMLRRVEDYHLQPRPLKPLHSRRDSVIPILASCSLGHPGTLHSTTATQFTSTSSVNLASPNPEGERCVDPNKTNTGLLDASPEDLGSQSKSTPRYGKMKVNMPRPMTVIGQVRYSIVSGMSTAASRPKSVPIFDLDRYEKEILGVGHGRSDLIELKCDANGKPAYNVGIHSRLGASEGESTVLVPGDLAFKESSRSRNSTFADVFTDTCKSSGQLDIGDGDWDLFPDHPTLSHSEKEEEREATYRKIVKALRRASSVSCRKASDQTAAGHNLTKATRPRLPYQRPIQIASPLDCPSSLLDTITDKTSVEAPRSVPAAGKCQAGKAHSRVLLPTLPRHNVRALSYNNNPYLPHWMSIAEAVPSIPVSSAPSALSTGSGPSLPMLLIHREKAIAAQEQSMIQNLYLHPVLQEAKSRVIVWLPSQKEQLYWGAYGRDGAQFEQCACHVASRETSIAADSSITTIHALSGHGSTPKGETDALSLHVKSMFGQSTSTLAAVDEDPPSSSNYLGHNIKNKHSSPSSCTCHLYQEVVKAVTNAVALADQEIRDLRTIGLTVWLDSRHVIWGQDNEEDGRLGDRMMISSYNPSILSPGAPLEERGAQIQVGDGLLSWIEAEEDVPEYEVRSCMEQGAPGIIGGSMGVIMKRPIGCYGRSVGDGEEDDMS